MLMKATVTTNSLTSDSVDEQLGNVKLKRYFCITNHQQVAAATATHIRVTNGIWAYGACNGEHLASIFVINDATAPTACARFHSDKSLPKQNKNT